MDEPVELHAIVGHTTSVDGETEVPEVPKDDENEYMKINTLAERMTTLRTPRNSTPRNVDGVADNKSESDTAALRKVQIFCLVLLMIVIISSVTIGILVNTLMQRTGDLKIKISELQNRPIMELLNTSIGTLETNMTMQSITMQEYSLRLEQVEKDIESATTIRDFNNSLLQLETRVKTLAVAVSNNSISINLIHADLKMAKNSLANLSNRVTVNEIDKQSDSAAVEDTQQRISRVEMDSNVTESLLQTIESRLTYLQDVLNCTWGNWTSFSSCSATCGDGLQYRERSLEGFVTDSNRQWCARKEIDIQTCIIKSCKPEDCSGFTAGSPTDGVYHISPNRSLKESVPVYCEFTSDGAWTVIQKRFDGSVDFYRTWQEYKTGFGDVNGEYWLGNDAIHNLTSHGTYRLKIRLVDWDGNTVFANYTTFRIASESDGYRLSIDGYSGDAGDSMYNHNGSKFSTRDVDNDNLTSRHCAVYRKGAGWYNECGSSNLNSLYYHTPHTKGITGISWYHWKGHFYSLKATTMMIQANRTNS